MSDEKRLPWEQGDSGEPILHAVRCEACGTVLFPPQSYGCTRCGAYGDRLTGTDIAAAGTLTAYAVVRTHQSHAVPFTLGDIQLDAGPTVRVELAGDAQPAPGARYTGRAVDGDRPSLQFIPEGQR